MDIQVTPALLTMASGLILWGPAVLSAFGCFIYYIKYLRPTYCKNNASLIGKTVVITGCNSGIGKETAVDLAKRGARIIMACRSPDRATEALNNIKQRSGNPNVVYRKLDLADKDSIRQFAQRCIQEEQHIDILINNAGTYTSKGGTVEGYDRQIWVNHFGHFLLTHLLLDLLKSSAPSRIINISSVVHSLPTDFMYLKQKCFPAKSDLFKYSASKLANLLFTRELASRLKNTGVSVFCVHPGYVYTSMSPKLTWPIFTSALAGAQTSIFCAVDEQITLHSGRYFANCEIATCESELAKDEILAEKVWNLSLRATGLEEDLIN